jgi:hypothetical protein
MAARSKGSRVTVVLREEASSAVETVTLKITVPVETKRILQIEALGRGCSLGDVVAELVRSVPRRWVLSERGRGSRDPSVPSAEDGPGLSLAGDTLSDAG